jgi:hypothetical protein
MACATTQRNNDNDEKKKNNLERLAHNTPALKTAAATDTTQAGQRQGKAK